MNTLTKMWWTDFSLYNMVRKPYRHWIIDSYLLDEKDLNEVKYDF